MGTFMLVLTVGCNVRATKTDPTAQGVFVAISIASCLMITIYALGPIHKPPRYQLVLSIMILSYLQWSQ